MTQTELTIRCECGTDYLDIDLYLELDEEDSYMTFSSRYGQRQSWRERFKAVWLILRGKGYAFNEVILDPVKLTQIRDFLSINLEPQYALEQSQAKMRADLTHVHEWVPAANDVIKSGYICFPCGSIKASA